jgi:hypothetical protein
MKLTKKELEAQKLIVNEVEKAINLLIRTSENFCKENLTKAVPIVVLKEFERVLLENFKKGAE